MRNTPKLTTRKPYVRPAIIHALELQTQTQVPGSQLQPGDPGGIDPDLPGKPVGAPRSSGGNEPILPPKPIGRPSGGSSSDGGDPPLPPKPPKP